MIKTSFVRKTILLFVSVCIVPVTILSLVYLQALHKAATERVNESLELLISEKAETMTRKLTAVENDARNLALWASHFMDLPADTSKFDARYHRSSAGVLESTAKDNGSYLPRNIPLTKPLESVIVRTEGIVPMMKNVKERNESITTVYIVTKDGYMRIYPWLDNIVFPDGHDQRADVFYTIAEEANNPTGEIRWTAPYFDYAGHGWITTCSSPYYVDGVFKGVMCVDVQLERLTASVVDFRIGDTGFAFIITDGGAVIYHPDMNNIVTDMGSEWKSAYGADGPDAGARGKQLAHMRERESGLLHFREKDIDKTLAYRQIKRAAWIIGIEIDRDDYALGRGYAATGIPLVIGLLFLLLIAFGIFLSRRVTKPIMELTAGVRKIGDGKFEPIPVTSDDEIGELSATFNNMNADLKKLVQAEKMAGAGQMMAGVFHELKNPLSVIRGSVWLLRNADATEADKAAALRETETSLARAEAIIYNMLDFARISSSGEAAYLLKTLIEQILLLVRQDCARQKIVINLTIPDDLTVYGNGDAFRHILLNTVTNAVEAMPAEGILSISAEEDGGVAIIEIHNTGRPIPQAKLKRIFEPFYTTKREGTGLGLWIVSREIEKIGGGIRVENGPRGGVTAEIRLPSRGQGARTGKGKRGKTDEQTDTAD
jgi:signal transduction histidine kinase